MNHKEITIYGRLGKNPELRQTKMDRPFCTFTLVGEVYGEDKPRWHNIVMWEKESEHWAKVLRKDATIFVRGRVQEKSFNEKSYLEINADAIGFVDEQ